VEGALKKAVDWFAPRGYVRRPRLRRQEVAA